jgi:hypothetical protein
VVGQAHGLSRLTSGCGTPAGYVLPQMLHNMLRAVDASVEKTFMPIVRRIARVPHTHDVLLMRIATHEADVMHERLKQMCA